MLPFGQHVCACGHEQYTGDANEDLNPKRNQASLDGSVDGWSGDLEMATHVGFGRGPFEDPANPRSNGQESPAPHRRKGID